MGSHTRKLVRGAARELHHAERRSQQREQRFIALVSARWADVQRRFPQHRFYVASVLPEEAPKVRTEGVRKVIAVSKTGPFPSFRGWWEVMPLQQLVTAQDGRLFLFGIRTGPNELTPLKLHSSFAVELYVAPPERQVIIPDEAGRGLVIAPLETLKELEGSGHAESYP